MQRADALCNCTLYVGGAASYEAVEDVLQYNLELVSELFDNGIPLTPPSTAVASTATPLLPPHDPPSAFVLEQLRSVIPCSDVDRFLAADAKTWTAFLQLTPGFVRKSVTSVAKDDRAEATLGTAASSAALQSKGVCEVWDSIEWYSRELWKAIPQAELARVQDAFDAAYGGHAPSATPLPASGNGLSILTRVPRLRSFAVGQVLEILAFDGVPCGDSVARFAQANNATYTAFLRKQQGFVARETLVDDHSSSATVRLEAGSPNCTVWTRTRWSDMAAYEAVCSGKAGSTACADVHSQFVSRMGFDPPMRRLPMPVLVSDTEAPFGPRLAVLSGIDVVAYHSLAKGDHDVRGSPKHRRWLNSSTVLPPRLRHMHPTPYEFWFANEENAATFESDPFRFLPAFGGHCTHGIASRGDLNDTLLADGRVAFTCVNGSRWALLNGTLYMNSCGMWEDFIKQPDKDARAAQTSWRRWFGDWFGPINDACVQDQAAWGGNPIGGLIPQECVLN